MKITSFFLFFCFSLIFNGKAQNSASLYGFITDKETSETLLQSNVVIKGTTRGVASNNSGYYTFSNLSPGTYIFEFSYVGYETKDIEITLKEGEKRRLDVALAPSSGELDEVIVTSDRIEEEKKNIGVATVSTELIKSLPAVFEADVFRSVQLLPGVTAANDFSSALYIRGGGPDQTLILLDRTTVYNPSHFFGFFSTFNPDAVKDIQLYKGGYPAKYGGRLGAVLDIYNKDGNRNAYAGGFTLGMLASKAYVEGPFKYGSWMIAARRSTLEPLLYALRQNIENIPELFYFVDVNGKVNIDAGLNDKFTVAFYGGNDNVRIPFTTDAVARLNYGNQTGSMSWTHLFSDRFFSNLTVTGSRYFSFPTIGLAGTEIEQANNIFDFSLKFDTEYIISEKHTIESGIWAGNLILKFNSSFDGNESFSSRIQTQYASFYTQDTWRPTDAWKIGYGVRGNYFSEGNALRIDPRLSVEHQLNSKVRLQSSVGGYSQFLTLITNEAFSGFDTWLTTGQGVDPAYGWQYILGTKTRPIEGYGFDVELYYRSMDNLFELDPTVPNPAGLSYAEIFRFGDGYAMGTEVLLEKNTGKLTGYMGYTWGRTRRKFPNVNNNQFFPASYDRTHDVNMVLTYQLSKKWKVTSVFSYATGQAFTLPVGRSRTLNSPFNNEQNDFFDVTKVNASRLPAYHRLDIGFTKAGTFFGLGESEFQIQIINVYNRKNVWFQQYDFEQNPIDISEVGLLPILPTLSYSVKF